LRFLAISDTEFTSFQQSDDDDGLFAELDNFGSSTIGDELEEYLKAPTIATIKDPLAWWHAVGDTSAKQKSFDIDRWVLQSPMKFEWHGRARQTCVHLGEVTASVFKMVTFRNHGGNSPWQVSFSPSLCILLTKIGISIPTNT